LPDAVTAPCLPASRCHNSGTLRSEFTTIRSVRSTYLTLIVLFVASLALAIIASADNRSDAGADPAAHREIRTSAAICRRP
jgi:hypothetical protein